MIRSVKLVGSMCLFVFTLFVQAQEIQPKGNQPDSLMNQVTLSASDNDGFYNQDFLNAQPAVEETKFLRHVRFEKPVVVKMDGKKKQGVVMMPEM